MSLEITRAKSTYTYRINAYNGREIDRRENRHNARWARFATYPTPQEATAALLQLESGDKEGDGAS